MKKSFQIFKTISILPYNSLSWLKVRSREHSIEVWQNMDYGVRGANVTTKWSRRPQEKVLNLTNYTVLHTKIRNRCWSSIAYDLMNRGQDWLKFSSRLDAMAISPRVGDRHMWPRFNSVRLRRTLLRRWPGRSTLSSKSLLPAKGYRFLNLVS